MLLTPVTLFAAGGEGAALQEANIDLGNTASLQRGAKYFVNYCMGCHSLKYSRYSRVGQDLGISDIKLQPY
jgi:ubiquinol-cytochrome c reductase cytochrome c1 subunit